LFHQIQQTVIKFIQAVHSSEYSNEQNSIYEDLLLNINSQQDSVEDLDFWARTYRVNVLTESISSELNQNDDDNENIESQTTTQNGENFQENETANLTTIEENTNQSVAETEEEQSVANKTTTSAKTKSKKKKNNAAELTTPDAT